MPPAVASNGMATPYYNGNSKKNIKLRRVGNGRILLHPVHYPPRLQVCGVVMEKRKESESMVTQSPEEQLGLPSPQLGVLMADGLAAVSGARAGNTPSAPASSLRPQGAASSRGHGRGRHLQEGGHAVHPLG